MTTIVYVVATWNEFFAIWEWMKSRTHSSYETAKAEYDKRKETQKDQMAILKIITQVIEMKEKG